MRGEINFYPIPDSNNYNMYDNFQNKKSTFLQFREIFQSLNHCLKPPS